MCPILQRLRHEHTATVMKFKKSDNNTISPDMTPMIDMTFQLIAFFMILINFAEGEQDQRVQLPSSTLAKPPDSSVVVVRLNDVSRLSAVTLAPEMVAPLTSRTTPPMLAVVVWPWAANGIASRVSRTIRDLDMRTPPGPSSTTP